MSALPRNRVLKLNDYEMGWLRAALWTTLIRAEKEVPGLYLQIQIIASQIYAESEGHPAQKQAKEELVRFKKMFEQYLKKENAGKSTGATDGS